MEGIKVILSLICVAAMTVGAGNFCWQIFKAVRIDAESRGMKYPKLWGLFSANGNNSSGLLLYFIIRRKYPVIKLSEVDKKKLESRKIKAGVGLIFVAVGTVSLLLLQLFM